MKILLVGGGGREHALAAAIAASPSVTALTVAPGNPGMEALPLLGGGATRLASRGVDDLDGLVALAGEMSADLVVVGPEQPLAEGLSDRLRAAGVPVCGPSKAAARLETSKIWAKTFLGRHGVPTAPFDVITTMDQGRIALDTRAAPYVVKDDGLAAGKGVAVCDTRAKAEEAIAEKLAAGADVLVEDFMPGEEVSVFALCDGETAVFCGAAQDHKRLGEGDVGPNTGGMGAYSPPPLLTPELRRAAMDQVIAPTLAGMKAEGAPFQGFLYAGLMLTKTGLNVVEFNVRFGDPEAQVVLPRIASDLAPYLMACAHGGLRELPPLNWLDEHAMTVVMAAEGYPEAPIKGGVIAQVEHANALTDVEVYHAGTARREGALIANGGRVLAVTGMGADLRAAADRAYAGVQAIDWADGIYRRDIGWRVLGRAAAVSSDA